MTSCFSPFQRLPPGIRIRMHRLSSCTSPRLVAFQHAIPLSSSTRSYSLSRTTAHPFRPSISPSSTGNLKRQRSSIVKSSATAAAPSSSKSNEREEVSVIPRSEDYSAWYQSVITSGGLSESSPVRGCPIIKPHGFAIWELLRDCLDKRIKDTGVKNAYFPLLIPQSFLSKEAEHVEGFAKECAIVTHHRLRAKNSEGGTELEPDPEAKLDDPLIIRPTSETIIWQTFSKWISSYRDLPLKINQWANVIRWEMRTRPFLRTAEFLWQEGHTAHLTTEEADAKAIQMINMYASVLKDMLSIPVMIGKKSPSERFAGAQETYTIEAMMQNGWALQAGTSHFLGDSFPRAFNVTYTDQNGELQYPFGTSWGITTRLLGALIMTHSDDTGLVLPPSVAPTQVAVVLIFKNDQQRQDVLQLASQVVDRLKNISIRLELDDREGMRPGAKYYEWERKGVPLRLEIGPKDAKKGAVFAARRMGGKQSIAVDEEFEQNIQAQLDSIQNELFDSADKRMNERLKRVESYEEMKGLLTQGDDSQEWNDLGFFLVPWKCDADNEKKVKEETKATLRCYPQDFQQECEGKSCFFSGDPATHMAIFARAY